MICMHFLCHDQLDHWVTTNKQSFALAKYRLAESTLTRQQPFFSQNCRLKMSGLLPKCLLHYPVLIKKREEGCKLPVEIC